MGMQQGLVAERTLGYQQLLAAAVDAGTLLTVPDGTVLALVICEGQAVRWRDDGQDPTTTIGMPLAVGQTLRLDSQGLKRTKFISQVAGAILNISYYGP